MVKYGHLNTTVLMQIFKSQVILTCNRSSGSSSIKTVKGVAGVGRYVNSADLYSGKYREDRDNGGFLPLRGGG